MTQERFGLCSPNWTWTSSASSSIQLYQVASARQVSRQMRHKCSKSILGRISRQRCNQRITKFHTVITIKLADKCLGYGVSGPVGPHLAVLLHQIVWHWRLSTVVLCFKRQVDVAQKRIRMNRKNSRRKITKPRNKREFF